MIVEVADAADPRLDSFRWRERQLSTRRDRREKVALGLFVAEGDLVVERAIAAGCEAVAMLCAADTGLAIAMSVDPLVPVYVADDALRKEVTGLGVPLRATGLFRRPAPVDANDLMTRSRRIVIAEAVDNPTNLGAVVRSAAALGWDGLVLDATSADPLARRALRVSMGTGLVLPFARLSPGESIADLCSRHACTSVALSPDAPVTISQIPPVEGRLALVLGSERAGLTADVLDTADVVARIPMHAGVDSLNVGAAAAIALHALGPDATS
jgi:tRNA G18 (ribose-2'-O)-methylase SpoU